MSRRFPGRRFSFFRLTVLLAVIGAIVLGVLYNYRAWKDDANAERSTPWFAAYVDVTATPSHAFETPRSSTDRHVALGFVVAAAEDECAASWGAYLTPEQARRELELDRRVARLQQAEGSITVSFGGAANTELALACTDTRELTEQYAQIVERYRPAALDFDIEGEALADAVSRERRAVAVARLQQEVDERLTTWLTLPVGPDGLTSDGVETVRSFLRAGVSLDGVNVMTMNFTGDDAANDQSKVAIRALEATHRQLKAIYADHGQPIGDSTAWRMIGATPMIGQNDVRGEVFTLRDARALRAFAVEVGLGRMSMWSANRDSSCAAAYADLSVLSDSCSGVDQGEQRFGELLGKGFSGSPAGDLGVPSSTAPLQPDRLVDDPESSPYPVWEAAANYPADTRIVWRHNVYRAKWWNVDVQPDDPSLSPADNAWELIGPVLPGETPVEQLRLPETFYPRWDAETVYLRGDRVMFDGLPYEAKWWTEGENPAAGQSDPGSTPWRALGQQEIEQLLKP